MKLKPFKAYQVSEIKAGKFASSIIESTLDKLIDGEVLIKIHYSSLNYKDALSASGNRGVTRNYPHVPGIDAAGVVELSNAKEFKPGDQVLVTGFDFGMNTSGGYAQYAKVPSKWLVRLPKSLSLRKSMIYGTAGFTAGLSLAALLRNGITPEKGPVAVTGATGGVGSISVAILAKLGYDVIAVSSKHAAKEFLLSIGAKEVIPRTEVEDSSGKILLKPRFAAAIDTVGGQVLSTVIKSLRYEGVVTTCGMVNGADLQTTVFPFILKGIQLIGIDSVELPIEKRLSIWEKLATEWQPDQLEIIASEITLDELPEKIDDILHGQIKGRVVVKMI